MKKINFVLISFLLIIMIEIPVYSDFHNNKNIYPKLSYTGTISSSIYVYENLNKNFSSIDTENQAFAINYYTWTSKNFTMSISNVRDKYFTNHTVQNETVTEDIFWISGFNESAICQPQEIGSYYTFYKKSYIKNIYLKIGFSNIYTGNLETYKMIIGNTSIELRENDNGVPYENVNLRSVPLRNCIILENEDGYGIENESYNYRTIGDIIDNEYSSTYLSKILIKVPIDYEVLPGIYWFMINATHIISTDYGTENIKVFFYDDGYDDAPYVNRTYNVLGSYSTDDNTFITGSTYDMYLVIESKVSSYDDPTLVNLMIDDTSVDSDGTVSFQKTVQDATFFTYTSNPEVYLTCLVTGNFYRERTGMYTSYTVSSGENVEWYGEIVFTENDSYCNYKNASITFPLSWNITTLYFDENFTYFIVNNTVYIPDTTQLYSVHYHIKSENVLFSVFVPSKVNASSPLISYWTGSVDVFDIELWCNDTYILSFTSVSIGYVQINLYPDLENGTGYYLIGKYQSSNNVGYLKSEYFEIVDYTKTEYNSNITTENNDTSVTETLEDSSSFSTTNETETSSSSSSDFSTTDSSSIPSSLIYTVVGLVSVTGIGIAIMMKKGKDRYDDYYDQDFMNEDEEDYYW